MWPMVILSVLIGVTTVFALEHQSNVEELNRSSVDQADVISFIAYRKAVIDYSNDNPGVTGEINDTDLATYFAYGFNNPGVWRNIITTDSLFVFTERRLNAEILNERFYRSLLVGKNVGGELVSLSGQVTALPLPTEIPANALVIAGK